MYVNPPLTLSLALVIIPSHDNLYMYMYCILRVVRVLHVFMTLFEYIKYIVLYKKKICMQLARHTRLEGYFKVWATIYFCQGPLPPTPRAETGLPPFAVHMCVGLGIIH